MSPNSDSFFSFIILSGFYLLCKIMVPCYGWDSTASRLHSHYEEALFFFTTKLPSISSLSKKLLPTIFQFSRTDSKSWCDVLRDLVPIVQFKKREKHSWESVTFGKDADF